MKIDVVSPFPIESLPRVWAWSEPFRAKISDDFGPQSLEEFIDAMLEAEGRQKSWAVYGDGELGGMITFQRLTPWLGTAHCVFKPDFQGRGIAPEACRIAVTEMFADNIGKLVFYPLAGNVALGSMLLHMGAKCEGQLRAHTLCGGKPKAMNVYGLLKQEFENATSNWSSSHRRGSLDPRELPVGKAEDHNVDDDADLGPGTTGPVEPGAELRDQPDEQHRPGLSADEAERAGPDQPAVRDDAGADLAPDGGERVRV